MNLIRLTFIDGVFNQSLSDLTFLPTEVNLVIEEGFTLKIPTNIHIEEPLHICFLNKGKNILLKNKIIMAENSQLTLIEEYHADHENPYVNDLSMDLQFAKNASLNYAKLQNENKKATHHYSMQVAQQADSSLNVFLTDLGSLTVKMQVQVNLSERDAAFDVKGLYFLDEDHQWIDNAVHVTHHAPFSMSGMSFKGVLNKKSKASFFGKVVVDQQAEHISANQANHNLLLSHNAEVNIKPHLEVYANQIKSCRHGATVGQLNKDALFYLRSRGIEEEMATQLLIEGFTSDMINQITHPLIRSFIQEKVGVYAKL